MSDKLNIIPSKEDEEKIVANLFSEEDLIVRQAAFDVAEAGLTVATNRLAQLFFSDSVGVQEAAEEAIRKIRGSQAVKEMLTILKSENVTVRNTAVDVLREIGIDDEQKILEYLSNTDTDVRIYVADILGYIDSSLVITELCHVLLQDAEINVRNQAAISLGRLRSVDALPSLLKALNDNDWVQYSVIDALSKIKDPSCVEILMAKLENASPFLTFFIFEALGSIAEITSALVLLEYLEKCDNEILRNKALVTIIQILGSQFIPLLEEKLLGLLHSYILVALEKNNEENLPILLEALVGTGSSLEATDHVLKLALEFDPEEKAEILQKIFECILRLGYNESLDKALFHENEIIRTIAIDACGQMSSRAGPFALKRNFDQFNPKDKLGALKLLSIYGDNRDIMFFLDILHSEADINVTLFALSFLGEEMQYVEAAPTLLKFLEHTDPQVKAGALDACLALENEDVLNIIVDYIYSEDPLMRGLAVQAMGATNAEFFADKLILAIKDTDTNVRLLALYAISDGWKYSLEKIATIDIFLNDPQRELRINAIKCFELYADELALPVILKTLKDTDMAVKLQALGVIGQNGLHSAIPNILPLIDDPSMLIKLELIEVLGVLGGDLAFESLMHFMSNESLDIQKAAAKAIENIHNSTRCSS